MIPTRTALASCALLALAACGGSQTPAAQDTTAATSARRERPREADADSSGGMTIEGQLGYLSEEQLMGALGPAQPRLAACYTDRLAEHSFVYGRVTLKIRIGADGTPRWVIPTNSTVGDHAIHQCLIERTMALRFPRPRGGETETTLPLEFDGGDDARPAMEWPAGRIDRAVAQHRAALERCTHGAHGPYEITLYAAPRGVVATAGVSLANDAAAAAVDCLVHEVSAWHLPDPGSWYAKASIRLE